MLRAFLLNINMALHTFWHVCCTFGCLSTRATHSPTTKQRNESSISPTPKQSNESSIPQTTKRRNGSPISRQPVVIASATASTATGGPQEGEEEG
jgi:hypothetical protein